MESDGKEDRENATEGGFMVCCELCFVLFTCLSVCPSLSVCLSICLSVKL